MSIMTENARWSVDVYERFAEEWRLLWRDPVEVENVAQGECQQNQVEACTHFRQPSE